MVPDFVRLGFTAEIPLPNQGFPARFLGQGVRADVSLELLSRLRYGQVYDEDGLYWLTGTRHHIRCLHPHPDNQPCKITENPFSAGG